MSDGRKRVVDAALALPPVERAALVEDILSSFDSCSSEEVDALWAKEVKDRIDAHEQGEIRARRAMCEAHILDVPLRRGVRLCRYLLVIGWLAGAVATVGSLVEAEFTALCGPVIFVLGLAIFACGITARNRRALILGASHCGICLLLLGLVEQFNWGPRQAQAPFLLIGTAYTAFAAWLTVQARKTLVQCEPWQCRNCGYALFGLSEPRCPECGMRFDPAKLAMLRLHESPSASHTPA